MWPGAASRYHETHPTSALAMESTSPKREVVEMLSALPDNSTYEDIQHHLYVLEKVRRGRERAEQEGAFSHADAKARLKKWLSS
jgi:hypothetical protein